MKNLKPVAISAALVAAFVVGVLIGRGGGAEDGHGHDGHGLHASNDVAASFWTCSMHPNIQLRDSKAKCPICHMDLIPVTDGAGDEVGPRDLSLSPSAQKLAGIQTTAVERRFVDAAIRLVGKIDYDETRLGYITARVPGRLDRLYVDYTGVSVAEGDHMVRLYSPELLEAQQTLIQALETAGRLRNSESALARQRAVATVESSREKLRLWGLDARQIARIEASEKPEEHLTINAASGGIVVDKNAVEGMYVQTGTRIYTIADLSRVWVMLDAYESDLAWLHYGQTVELETEAYPGERFSGKIAFIDPALNPRTRTVKVRVNVENADGRLKPEMFVRAVVHSRVASGGKVMDPGLAGKWISPMHPEIVKDKPGDCDICGMALVKAEELGYVSADAGTDVAPLVIPVSAPLLTGKRAVVYIEKAPGLFEGREIALGPRAGDFYLVNEGLQEGEQVVTKGAFKIDSAIQIQAKPSMMNPGGGGPEPGHQHHGHEGHTGHDREEHEHARTAGGEVTRFETPAAFGQQLAAVYDAYLVVQKALSADKPGEAKAASTQLLSRLGEVDMSLVKGDAHAAWMALLAPLSQGGGMMANASSIDDARKGFESVSNAMILTARQFGVGDETKANVFHCPMAFGNKGASWLQATDELENPYFGAKMFRCGLLKETLGAVGKTEGEGK